MFAYTKVIIDACLGTFIAVKQNNKAFGISGKDSDGKFFWLVLSKEKLTEVRDLINKALEA